MLDSDKVYHEKLKFFYADIAMIGRLSLFKSWREIYDYVTSQLFELRSLDRPVKILNTYVKVVCSTDKIVGYIETNGQYKILKKENLEEEYKLPHSLLKDLKGYGSHISYITPDGHLYLTEIQDGNLTKIQEISISAQVSQVSLSSTHLLFLTVKNDLYGLGSNKYGKLGGVTEMILEPKLIDHKVIQAHCGQHHSIYLTENNGVFGAGRNNYGQFGLDFLTHSEVFILLANNIVQIYAFQNNTALINTKAELLICGQNNYGQLGILPSKSPHLKSWHLLASSVSDVFLYAQGTLFMNFDQQLFFVGTDQNLLNTRPLFIFERTQAVSFNVHSANLIIGYYPSQLSSEIQLLMSTALSYSQKIQTLPIPAKITKKLAKFGLNFDLLSNYPDQEIDFLSSLPPDLTLTAKDIEFLISSQFIDINLIYPFFRSFGQPSTALISAASRADIPQMKTILEFAADPDLLDESAHSALDTLFLSFPDLTTLTLGLELLLQFRAQPTLSPLLFPEISANPYYADLIPQLSPRSF